MKKLVILGSVLTAVMLMTACGSSDDETEEVVTSWYQDTDGDNFGDPATEFIGDRPDESYVSDNTDCDDTGDNADIKFPGNTEIFDGIDNNCDGNIDEGLQVQSEVPLNGCTEENATDLTSQSTVNMADTSPWAGGHSACIIVSANTTVTWAGNFSSHPLIGGMTPTENTTSPITIAGPGVGTSTVAVNFVNTGDYPYFCRIHTSSMQGVVYVR